MFESKGREGQHMKSAGSERLKVLIFHIRISMGHERAAQALASSFRRRLGSGVDVRLVEAIGYSSGWMAPVVCKSYLSVVKYVPPVWDFLYDHPTAGILSAPLFQFWVAQSRKKFLRIMSEFQPDLVVCTQALPARILAELKAQGHGGEPGMRAPVYAVVTDFGVHRHWAAPDIDGYFLATPSSAGPLESMGVPKEKIHCTGIPIHPDISGNISASSLESMRRDLGLEPGRPTILFMGGSRGIGLKRDLTQELEHLPIDVNILASAGTNPKAMDAMRSWSAVSRHRVIPLEYTQDIRTLYALSDLAITKPGGLTLAECMAVGLPMVIQHSLPGQERHNLEFVRRAGLGEIGTDARDVVSRVSSLLMNPSRLAYLRARLKTHARPEAAFEIVDCLLERGFQSERRSAASSVCPAAGH